MAMSPSGNQELFRPGETAPLSSMYYLVNERGIREGADPIPLKEGDPFPPTGDMSLQYAYYDATHHDASESVSDSQFLQQENINPDDLE